MSIGEGIILATVLLCILVLGAHIDAWGRHLSKLIKEKDDNAR